MQRRFDEASQEKQCYVCVAYTNELTSAKALSKSGVSAGKMVLGERRGVWLLGCWGIVLVRCSLFVRHSCSCSCSCSFSLHGIIFLTVMFMPIPFLSSRRPHRPRRTPSGTGGTPRNGGGYTINVVTFFTNKRRNGGSWCSQWLFQSRGRVGPERVRLL